MIDIKLVRERPDFVKKKVQERGYEIDINSLVKIDDEWRKAKLQSDSLRAERNKVSIQISELKKAGKDVSALMKKAKEIPKKLHELEEEMNSLDKKRNEILHEIPNFQDDSVPIGGEEKNKQTKKWGKTQKFKFKPKNHSELLENLGLLDLKAAIKLSGSGFYILKGKLAQLERALINFMLDFHAKSGLTEINAPQLVNEKTLFGTGQLPKFEKDVYKTTEGLFLIPTSEVSLTNLYAGETLDEKELPIKLSSFTQCYRTEAGKHGSETPGIFRLHQFEKVEMVYITSQDSSGKLLEEMTKNAEKLLEKLKIPYRKVLLATRDAGFASSKTYDLEVWSPSMNKYIECSSCSNCTDFQARRMNLRYLERKSNERKFAHTLNGSGLATPRLMISLIENNQQKDGTIKIPSALVKYTGFKKLDEKN